LLAQRRGKKTNIKKTIKRGGRKITPSVLIWGIKVEIKKKTEGRAKKSGEEKMTESRSRASNIISENRPVKRREVGHGNTKNHNGPRGGK